MTFQMNCNNIARIYEKEFYSNDKIWIIAYVADRCNCNCQYCYNKRPRTGELLDLNVLRAFLEAIHKKTHCHIDLELIGGEPTLHPEIYAFCQRLVTYNNVSVKVFTNFSQDVGFYRKLLKLDNVNVFASWHSLPNDKLNLSFIDKAKQMSSSKITYCIMFENDNWSNSTDAFRQLMYIDCHNVETSLIGGDDNNIYKYTQSQLSFYRNSVQPKLDIKFNAKYTIEMKNGDILMSSFNDLYLNDDIQFNGWKCDAGYRHLYVHANGNVYKCQSCYDYNDVAIANIYSKNAIDMIKFKPTICKFSTCSCTYNVLKENLRSISGKCKTGCAYCGVRK